MSMNMNPNTDHGELVFVGRYSTWFRLFKAHQELREDVISHFDELEDDDGEMHAGPSLKSRDLRGYYTKSAIDLYLYRNGRDQLIVRALVSPEHALRHKNRLYKVWFDFDSSDACFFELFIIEDLCNPSCGKSWPVSGQQEPAMSTMLGSADVEYGHLVEFPAHEMRQ